MLEHGHGHGCNRPWLNGEPIGGGKKEIAVHCGCGYPEHMRRVNAVILLSSSNRYSRPPPHLPTSTYLHVSAQPCICLNIERCWCRSAPESPFSLFFDFFFLLFAFSVSYFNRRHSQAYHSCYTTYNCLQLLTAW